MSQLQSEVRPLVRAMPRHGFNLQTGGSARRRVIKPFHQQYPESQTYPTQNEFRVSGVPGHTHNSSAIASVMCDLERKRGFLHDITDAWGTEPVRLNPDDLGDSDAVVDAAARFDRAIERGVGEIALIPENCHQEIREPVRSIAEVRRLVAPHDRLQTMTYVEEVGGFVHAQPYSADVPNGYRQTGGTTTETTAYISDFPDILVDLIGQNNINKVDLGLSNEYTGDPTQTPLMIIGSQFRQQSDGTWDGVPNSRNYVVLQPTDGPIGTLEDGSEWAGVVRFKWNAAEKLYESEAFSVRINRVVPVGSRLLPLPVGVPDQPAGLEDPADLPDGGDPGNVAPPEELDPNQLAGYAAWLNWLEWVAYRLYQDWVAYNQGQDALFAARFQNDAATFLEVSFPKLKTTVAQDGYCVLATNPQGGLLSGRTCLLGATQNNGPSMQLIINLESITKPGANIDQFYWQGPPAYRFLVGGNYALPGPSTALELNYGGANYFQRLRNMAPFNLCQHHTDRFFQLLEPVGQWGGAPDANHPVSYALKFGSYFTTSFNLGDLPLTFPDTNLLRSEVEGSTWSRAPIEPMPLMTTCQNKIEIANNETTAVLGVPESGHEVIHHMLAKAALEVPGATWRNSDVRLRLNESTEGSLTKVFMPSATVPPGIVALGTAAIDTWKQQIGNVNEATQAGVEQVQQDFIDRDAEGIALAAAVVAVDALYPQATPQQILTSTALALLNGFTSLLQARQATLDVSYIEEIAVQNALTAAAVAELARLVTMRVPAFDEWFQTHHTYDGILDYAFYSPVTPLGIHPDEIHQKMFMVPLQISFWKAGDVQAFAWVPETGTVAHTKDYLKTEVFSLLCDTNSVITVEILPGHDDYVEEGDNVRPGGLRVKGGVGSIFGLTQYLDMEDGGAAKGVHVRGTHLPPDYRDEYQALVEERVAAVNAGASAAILEQMAEAITELGARVDSVRLPYTTAGVGNVLEIMTHDDVPLVYKPTGSRPHLVTSEGDDVLLFQDLAMGFDTPRTFFLSVNGIGKKNDRVRPLTWSFSTADCTTELHEVVTEGVLQMHVCTRVAKVYDSEGDLMEIEFFHQPLEQDTFGTMRNTCAIAQFGPRFQATWFGEDPEIPVSVFRPIEEESRLVGPVFRSQLRISQHLCAPILNPNARIGCSAPLNYETPHLPPELRDFVLVMRDVDWSFLPGRVTLEPLTMYEFNGGNQSPAAEDNLLHLPQFREGSSSTLSDDGAFSFEVFSPYGMPSYVAVFARDSDFSVSYKRQPLIKQLSIMCNTTMKRSNTILEADVHQLYHMTQRNVNERARYDRTAFNHRQVVLLTAEDIGVMGIDEYQREKRAVFRFEGVLDQQGKVTALLIFDNRGLYINGKQLSVVRL